MYGMPSTVGTNTLQFGQLGAQPGSPAYAFRGLMPGPQMVQYQRPNASGTTTDSVPLLQLPYHSGSTSVGVTSCVHVQSESVYWVSVSSFDVCICKYVFFQPKTKIMFMLAPIHELNGATICVEGGREGSEQLEFFNLKDDVSRVFGTRK